MSLIRLATFLSLLPLVCPQMAHSQEAPPEVRLLDDPSAPLKFRAPFRRAIGPSLDIYEEIINGWSGTDDAVGLVRVSRGGQSSIGTGTLVTPSWVLTAAHVVHGYSSSETTVTLGGVSRSACQIFIHPQYNDERFSDGYDLAMIRLTSTASGIVPYSRLGTPVVGKPLVIMGYGRTGTPQSGGVPGSSGTLNVGITNVDRVTSTHLEWVFDDPSESNTCSGDSGGPNFHFDTVNDEWFIAGVTSGGRGAVNPCALGETSYSARVDGAYFSWIQQIVNNNTSCGGGGGGGGGSSCLIASLAEENYQIPIAEGQFDTIRAFRDQVLRQNEETRALVSFYYKHGGEARKIAAQRPRLTRDLFQVMHELTPSLAEAAATNGVLTLTDDLWARGMQILADIEAHAGDEMRRDIATVRNVIRSRAHTDGTRHTIDFTDLQSASFVPTLSDTAGTSRGVQWKVAFAGLGLAAFALRGVRRKRIA